MLRFRWSLALGLGLVLGGSGIASAMLGVEAVVTPAGGGRFDYAITVTNGLPDEVVLVSLVDAPASDAVLPSTLVAPPGHGVLYDSDGVVYLAEDTVPFGPSTSVPGFAFSSNTLPASGVFERFEGYTVDAEVVTGTIQVTIMPEPGPIALGSAVLASLCLLRRRAEWRTRS